MTEIRLGTVSVFGGLDGGSKMRHMGLIRLLAVAAMSVFIIAGCGEAAQPAADATTQPSVGESTTPSAPTDSTQTGGSQTSGSPTSPADATQVSLTIGINVFPRSLDPTFDTTYGVQTIYRMIFEPLVTIGDDGEPSAALAEAWDAVDDTTWEIRLRQDVTFHDGTPMTADDVKFTIDRVLDPETKAPWAARIDLIERVDVIDQWTVRIHTRAPFATMMKNLATIYILPYALWQAKGEEAFMNPPVGTGPFVFEEWTRDSSMTLSRNENYWGTLPTIASLTFRAMPEASTRLAALQAGEIDIATEVPPEQISLLEGAGFKIETLPVGLSMVVELKTTMGGPLTDKRVRQAINYAVNKEELVDALFGGHARVLDGQLVGPDAFGYNPDLEPYPYDPDMARQLLQEAGYDGSEIILATASGQYPKDKEVAELVAAQLNEVGLNVRISVLERAVRTEQIYNGTIGPMFIITWQYLPAMDAELPYKFHLSDSGWHLMSSEEFDRRMQQQAGMFESSERLKALQDLGAWFRDEAPVLFLYQSSQVYAVREGLSGVVFRPDVTIDLSQVRIES